MSDPAQQERDPVNPPKAGFAPARGSARATPGKKYRGWSIMQWAKQTGMTYSKIQNRIAKGKRAGMNQSQAVAYAVAPNKQLSDS